MVLLLSLGAGWAHPSLWGQSSPLGGGAVFPTRPVVTNHASGSFQPGSVLARPTTRRGGELGRGRHGGDPRGCESCGIERLVSEMVHVVSCSYYRNEGLKFIMEISFFFWSVNYEIEGGISLQKMFKNMFVGWIGLIG